MKLLYLAPVRFPSERAHAAQIAHMCHAFAQYGEVTLLVPKRKNEITQDAFSYFSIPKNFSLCYVFCTPWGVGSAFGFFSNVVAYILRAVWYVLFHKTEIIYTRNEGVLLLVSFFVSNKKLVWESHEAKFNVAARYLLKRGVPCVAISKGIADFYMQQGIPATQIVIADDGIDESFFLEVESKENAQNRLGITTDKPVVMYIGGLDEWKGVEVFLETASKLPNFQYVVIGGTDEAIEKYQQKYPEILFLGRRPYRELANNQQAADVLVCTNSSLNALSAAYTSPLKLFSYLTSRVPVLAADVPSITSVVSEKEVFLYNAQSPDSLQQQLQISITKSAEATKRADAARDLSQQFTWSKRAEKILAHI